MLKLNINSIIQVWWSNFCTKDTLGYQRSYITHSLALFLVGMSNKIYQSPTGFGFIAPEPHVHFKRPHPVPCQATCQRRDKNDMSTRPRPSDLLKANRLTKGLGTWLTHTQRHISLSPPFTSSCAALSKRALTKLHFCACSQWLCCRMMQSLKHNYFRSPVIPQCSM